MPFDRTGISTRVLRSDPVGVVLRADDRWPVTTRSWYATLMTAAGSSSPREPVGDDDLWSGAVSPAAFPALAPALAQALPPATRFATGPWSAPVSECVQAVLWNGTIGLAPPLTPLGHAWPRDHRRPAR